MFNAHIEAAAAWVHIELDEYQTSEELKILGQLGFYSHDFCEPHIYVILCVCPTTNAKWFSQASADQPPDVHPSREAVAATLAHGAERARASLPVETGITAAAEAAHFAAACQGLALYGHTVPPSREAVLRATSRPTGPADARYT